jgi:undecaprenyl-phosphate 4-deoxy-4-formamido-L-arabinose transferase
MNSKNTDASVPAVSIAVMCYNEVGNLRPMVERTVKTLRGMQLSFEIMIVDDGSKDGSAPLADALATEFPGEVRVLHHATNTGIGSVLIDGYRQTRGDIVAILPADLQFAPEDFPAAYEKMKDADVVNILRDKRNDPRMRSVISSFDRLLVWLLFGYSTPDLHWVKVYRRSLLERITIQSTTPLVDTELLVKSSRLKARIIELALPHHPRLSGQSHGATTRLLVKTFLDLLKLRLRLKL